MEEFFIALKKNSSHQVYFILNDVPEIPAYYSILTENYNSILLVRKTYIGYLTDTLKYLLEFKKTDQLIVHVHFSPISHLLIVLCYLMGIRNIFWTKHSRLLIKKLSKTWIFEKICTSFIRKKICVSNAVEQELLDLNLSSNKTYALPMGVNMGKYNVKIDKESFLKSIGIKKDCFIVTIVAHQRPEKKVNLFIESFSKFLKQNAIPNAVGLIVGGGPLEEENIELAKTLGIYEQLRFLGSRQDVEKIYNVSDIAGLTSLTEGMPLALLEASAAALPLFGTQVGGIPEIIQDGYNGFVFHEGNSDQLASIIKRYYIDEELRKKHGQNALDFVKQKFEINKCSLQLLELYEQCTK